MKMSDIEVGFAQDLASIATVADPEVHKALERIAGVWQPMLRQRLLELMSLVAADLSGTVGIAGHVELRVSGDDVSFSVVSEDLDPVAVVAAGSVSDAPAETPESEARISLRLSERLKDRIAADAAADGMSVNTWIVRALDREVRRPRATHHHPATTTRNQLRGYGRS